ncbi:glycerate kinase [Rhodococcus sp. HNM0569]|uniref:glycerate kinase family protein n=1 Tax=Rhodococcus sp. HNM0569 TaxID=2716340 RepID=UPI00146B17D4|nr:glycerate kinase [Rhodococcus sp. HNM0569]NLU82873.1 glycerate kinase [Rhodococcus sp. HNM0569]
MRVMIAPDSFGDTLTAVDACDAMTEGWLTSRPSDSVLAAPRSDGGPGFVDVLAESSGLASASPSVRSATVRGPLDDDVEARWLCADGVAYVESAQACGLALLGRPVSPDTARRAHSRGVGELVAHALDAGATTIVVGLGGSACTDGGRGLVDALGGLDAARERLAAVELVAATDVEHALLGREGAAHVFGPQKGADDETIAWLEDRNVAWARDLEERAPDVTRAPGAGAAGGLGAALLALGARRRSGAGVVADSTEQAASLRRVDLVLTGEGRLDEQSLRGKVVAALAAAAAEVGVPTVCLAGQVDVPAERLAAHGISSAFSLTDFAGSTARAMSEARDQLVALTAAVARDWTAGE